MPNQERILNETLQSATISTESLEWLEKKTMELEGPQSTVGKITAWVSKKIGRTTKQPPKELPPAYTKFIFSLENDHIPYL